MNQVPWSSNVQTEGQHFLKITSSNDHALCWCSSPFSLGQLKSCMYNRFEEHSFPSLTAFSGRMDPTKTLGRLCVVAGPIEDPGFWRSLQLAKWLGTCVRIEAYNDIWYSPLTLGINGWQMHHLLRILFWDHHGSSRGTSQGMEFELLPRAIWSPHLLDKALHPLWYRTTKICLRDAGQNHPCRCSWAAEWMWQPGGLFDIKRACGSDVITARIAAGLSRYFQRHLESFRVYIIFVYIYIYLSF